MKKNEFGVFEITVPAVNGEPAIPHDSKIKVCSICQCDSATYLTLIRYLLSSQMIMPEQIDFPPGSLV
jgi:hypothetical protein